MRHYAIGLDIGITSVGWATVALDADENPCGIIDLGARIFDAAEQPKTGESLAAPRRAARSARRCLRRHRHRNERIRSLMIEEQLISQDELEVLFDGRLEDIYALRVKALDEQVGRTDFARILLHISQRRGFKSNRKNPTTKEDGVLLAAVNENKQRMSEHGYRTVGEMFLLDETFKDHKRNKGGNYITTVARDMVADEVRAIFSAQRELGASFASEEFEERYLEILLSQRPFDEGPGGNSPYGGSQIERMVGRCTFFPDEPRAAKAAYSFEYFTLLQKVNHIRIVENGVSSKLTDEQRRIIIELAHAAKDVSYAKIRKVLKLSDKQLFNIRYTDNLPAEDSEKKEKLGLMKAYHQMRSAIDRILKGRFAMMPRAQRNAIGTALSLYKTSDKIRKYLSDAGLEEVDIDAADSIGSFSKFGHISVKACDMLIPFLEQGMNYNEACAAAGLNFKGHDAGEKSKLLHPKEEDYEDITSPVVRRAIAQTIKVINAIIRRERCSPTFINIELAREMAKDFRERNRIKKENDDNRAKNERLLERIRTEYGKNTPTGLDLVKLRLYEEQSGVCMYSLKQMSLEKLFEPNYAEVDHIVPYSISFDDSRKNKVLVLTEENRNKGNRLPLQYLKGRRREDFIVWVNNNVKDYRKRRLLLKEELTAEDESGFKERNLQDTKTMSRFLLNYISDNLEFAESTRGRKKKVTAVNGAVTAYMRKRWGITKIREDGDCHHAVDAVVIACTTDAMIRQVSRYARFRECEYMHTESGSVAVDTGTGEVLRTFPYPWPDFRKELEARIGRDPAKVINDLHLPFYMTGGQPLPEPVFVSRMPRRKVTGAAHKDTIKSARELDNGYLIVKRPLAELKLKNGEIENYYNPQSDKCLYDALKNALIEHGGDAKKAFAGEFRKPKSDGTPGPIVKKVKLLEPTTICVPVHGGKGAADNDSMVRVDVFLSGGKYYLVPIYVADTLKPELPNKAVTAAKPYSEWPEMSDEDFIFSLYPNDLICATSKNGITLSVCRKDSTLPPTVESKSFMLYYRGTDISTGSISCITHDNAYKLRGLGVKTLEKLEKYTVDVLGEYHKVGKEVRQPFNIKRRKACPSEML